MNKFTILFFIIMTGASACRSTKKISNAIAPKDTTLVKVIKPADDSLQVIKTTVDDFKKNYIDFTTFSAKIKIDAEDSKGKQPDLTAVLKIIKDSSIWISLSATFLNVEVYRILIEKNRVVLINKQDKEVQYRTIDYLQEVTKVPFTYKMAEELLIGNPVFFQDSISAFSQNTENITLLSVGQFFKHLITIDKTNKLPLHSKLDDVDIFRNRTADISYSDYESVGGILFATGRSILISEKSKLDIKMRFKQMEFNKDLSVSFNIPKNYKVK